MAVVRLYWGVIDAVTERAKPQTSLQISRNPRTRHGQTIEDSPQVLSGANIHWKIDKTLADDVGRSEPEVAAAGKPMRSLPISITSESRRGPCIGGGAVRCSRDSLKHLQELATRQRVPAGGDACHTG